MNSDSMRSRFSVFTSMDGETRVQRIKTILMIIELALIASILNAAFFTKEDMILEALVAFFILLGLFFFVSNDTANIVESILIWTIAILVFSLAWKNDGLDDTAIMVFPGLLVFSAMMGSALLVYSLLAFFVVVIYFFAYALDVGFIEPRIIERDNLWGKANYFSILLIIYVIALNLMMSFFSRIVRKLMNESQKIRMVNEEANKLATNDRLTSLPNEVTCDQNLQALIGKKTQSDKIVGFLSLSLDNIKLINSSLGHDIGDQVIVYQATQLSQFVNELTKVYRCSGNEFIIIYQSNDYEEIQNIAHQLIQLVNRPFNVADYDIDIECSIGIAIAPFDGEDYQALRKKSHLALSQAKENEINSCCFFETDMELRAHSRLKMIQELRQAIADKTFELYYQPKVDLENLNIIGAEALIRWRDQNGNFVAPSEFIPVAETSGLISDIGAWVIDQACRDCKRWQDEKLGELCVAVNLSPIQFKRSNLPHIVFAALDSANLTPSCLELEITESIFIDDHQLIVKQLNEFSRKGIGIAIDDFGTGYSNLNYLAKFNASSLKIDMSFVTNMVDIESKQHIVNAIIKMSDEMGLENVAEGVEDAETIVLLKDFNCQFGQGYFWTKPLPCGEFMQFVKEYTARNNNLQKGQ